MHIVYSAQRVKNTEKIVQHFQYLLAVTVLSCQGRKTNDVHGEHCHLFVVIGQLTNHLRIGPCPIITKILDHMLQR